MCGTASHRSPVLPDTTVLATDASEHHWSLYGMCSLLVWEFDTCNSLCVLVGQYPWVSVLTRSHIPPNSQDDFRIFLGKMVGTGMKILKKKKFSLNVTGFLGAALTATDRTHLFSLAISQALCSFCLTSVLSTKLTHEQSAHL